MKYYRSKNYVTASYDGRSARTPSLYVSALTANLLAIHLTSVVSPQSALSANNHMQCGNARSPLARLQNASNAAEPTRQILPTVLRINNSASYNNGNRTFRSRQNLLFSSSKLTVHLSSRQHIHTLPHKTWAQAASQPATPTDPHSSGQSLKP